MGHQLQGWEYRLLHIEGLMASSAVGVAGPVLYQIAEIAAQYFTRLHAH
jgi:hypothetical protein